MIVLGPGLVVPESALAWRTSRSGGPGGQNVNKVATKVELMLDLAAVPELAPAVAERLKTALGSRVDAAGIIHIVCDSGRSQARNREEALERLKELAGAALRPRKRRKKTAPTRGSKLRRLEEKRRHAERKSARRAPD